MFFLKAEKNKLAIPRGGGSDVFTGTKSVRKKVCTENKQCITGLRANVRLRSVRYVRVDKGCNCGDTGANGYGGCLCAAGLTKVKRTAAAATSKVLPVLHNAVPANPLKFGQFFHGKIFG